MRNPFFAALAAGAVFTAAPASAQTYDPSYPVCLQVFGRFSYFECGYTSIEQCRPSAVARAAQCVVNPYYAGSEVAPRVRHRHPRRAY